MGIVRYKFFDNPFNEFCLEIENTIYERRTFDAILCLARLS